MGSTIVELIKDLKQASMNIVDEKILSKIMQIGMRAKSGYYHDFKSVLAMPKTQLHIDLLDAGLLEIDKKMQNGDYDE